MWRVNDTIETDDFVSVEGYPLNLVMKEKLSLL